jgi:hypothetical protein
METKIYQLLIPVDDFFTVTVQMRLPLSVKTCGDFAVYGMIKKKVDFFFHETEMREGISSPYF